MTGLHFLGPSLPPSDVLLAPQYSGTTVGPRCLPQPCCHVAGCLSDLETLFPDPHHRGRGRLFLFSGRSQGSPLTHAEQVSVTTAPLRIPVCLSSEHDLGEDIYDCVPCEDGGDDIYEDIIKVEVQQPMNTKLSPCLSHRWGATLGTGGHPEGTSLGPSQSPRGSSEAHPWKPSLTPGPLSALPPYGDALRCPRCDITTIMTLCPHCHRIFRPRVCRALSPSCPGSPKIVTWRTV
ncbi:hypothetical protein P7K49_001951 [Saguinus oedipus]|uniref:Uncharacterized protein n=1 Tax=Saguinus oedipus TaxID=9490 RepID=A0ABQ9WGF7_SAGOE|nr:hypothetical protein P7K49_001951 [Saguinus oedipus]